MLLLIEVTINNYKSYFLSSKCKLYGDYNSCNQRQRRSLYTTHPYPLINFKLKFPMTVIRRPCLTLEDEITDIHSSQVWFQRPLLHKCKVPWWMQRYSSSFVLGYWVWQNTSLLSFPLQQFLGGVHYFSGIPFHCQMDKVSKVIFGFYYRYSHKKQLNKNV